jgi:hypothetical protein
VGLYERRKYMEHPAKDQYGITFEWDYPLVNVYIAY